MRRFNLMVMVLLTVLFFNSSSAWSDSRFLDLGDGTVLDTSNSIRWLKNANCFGGQNWYTALSTASNLASGACSLTDASVAGDWHLPTLDELKSLVAAPDNYRYDTLNAAGFNGVRGDYYWSSTTATDPGYTDSALSMRMGTDSYVAGFNYSATLYVWPVRNAQLGYLAVSPASFDFGSVTATATSASQTFTISNLATASVSVSSLALTGGDSGIFTLDLGDGTGGTCGATPTIAAKGSCTVSATFAPTSAGPRSTTLRITSNAANPTRDVVMRGNTLDPNVSWWKADGNANDSVGSNPGTLSGVGYGTGKVGQAFSFDGSASQYVSIPTSPSLNIFGTHTIAFWVKLNALPAAGKIYQVVSKWTNGAEYKVVNINANGTVAYFLFGTSAGSGVTSAAALQTGVWNHVVATYDGVNMKIYINGGQDASMPANNDVGDGLGTLYLGYNPETAFVGNEAYFDGLLDEVGWYDRTLSPVEVGLLADMPPDPFTFGARTGMPLNTTIVSDPVTITGIGHPTAISITGGEYSVSTDGGGTWSNWTNADGTFAVNNQVKVRQTSSSNNAALTTATLTIGSGTGSFNVTTAAAGDPDAIGLTAWWKGENNGYDTVGGNHGTLNGGVTYAAGRVGQAFSFDGSAQSVSIPTSSSLNIYGNHSVAFWVKFAANPPSGRSYYLVNKWTDQYEDKLVGIDESGKVVYFLFGTSGSGVTSAKALAPGVWNHVVATYDGGNMKIYINGVLDASAAASGDVADNSGGLYLGYNPARADQNSETPFNGRLDEIKWYNRTLSAEEITAMLPSYPLTVSVSGTGSGTVTSDTDNPGIGCPGACQASFAGGAVTLSQHPSALSFFGGWSGACSTDPCIVTMDAAKTVTATFNLAPVAKNITKALSYSSLATALAEAAAGDEIDMLDTQLDGAVTLTSGITLSGGWNATYQGLSGAPTTLNGDLTVQNGGSTAGSLDVKGKLVIQSGSLQANGVTVRP